MKCLSSDLILSSMPPLWESHTHQWHATIPVGVGCCQIRTEVLVTKSALTPAQSTTSSVSADLMQSEVTALSAQSEPELAL